MGFFLLLITGITGQDGSYLAEFLLEKGYEVHGITRRASISNTARIDHSMDIITLHDGDLSDSSSLIRIINIVQPDEIYNLAAQSHVQVSFDVPEYSGDVEEESLTIKVILNAGHSMNYHSHKNRDEVWVVSSGTDRTIVDGMEQKVKAGDVVTMQAGCRHTIIAESELKLVEIQIGREISVHDKQKYALEY